MNRFRTHADRRNKTPVLAFAPTPKGEDVATLRLYDPIDSYGEYWGVSAKEFVDAVDSLPSTTTEIRVLINSPGGEVWEALAMLNALRAHPARVVAVVEGIAASSASFIAAGVDELVMARNSELYIHNAWGVVMGDAEDLLKTANDLTKVDRNIADIYARKSGGSVEHWLEQMGQDLFLSADEAVAAGLADRIEGEGDAATARARFDLSAFTNRASSRTSTPTQPGHGTTNRKELPTMSDTFSAAVRARLGVTDTALGEEQILAALDEALSEQVDVIAPVAAIPEGVVMMDQAALDQLRADAQAGRDAQNQLATTRRDEAVNTALTGGRIAASSQKQWRDALDRDEAGTLALLASLAVNTIPVTETGHAEDVTLTTSEALYNQAFAATSKES